MKPLQKALSAHQKARLYDYKSPAEAMSDAIGAYLRAKAKEPDAFWQGYRSSLCEELASEIKTEAAASQRAGDAA